METATCSMRLCRQPAVGQSPITCQPVCDLHLKDDASDLHAWESAVAERIAHFRKYQAPLRLMQQRLASDLQLLEDSFNDLRDTLDRQQKKIVGAIAEHHDKMLDSLKAVADMDDFEKELKAAKESNDMRHAFIINRGMEKSLKTLQLDLKLLEMDEESEHVRTVAFPDVNSHVRDLHSCVDMHLTTLQKTVQILGVNETDFSLFAETEKEVKVSGKPVCMAVCRNSSGFVVDSSGSIVRAQAAHEGRELPQPSVFVAVASQSGSETCSSEQAGSNSDDSDDETSEFSIQLVSTDSQDSVTLTCSWDSQQPITDLHCDSDRQLLFIAQKHVVIATDLSGVQSWRMATSDIRDDVQKLHCIAGDSDKLFVAATLSDGLPVVFGLCKESGESQMTLTVSCLNSFSSCSRIATRDRMLLLYDGEERTVHTICTITNTLILSESTAYKRHFGAIEKFSAELCDFAALDSAMQFKSRHTILKTLPVDFTEKYVIFRCENLIVFLSLNNGGLRIVELEVKLD